MAHPDHFRSISRKAWIRHNGAIPDGYEIHHKDFDETNFDIDNLECLTPLEHRRRHVEGAPKRPGICKHCGGAFLIRWPYKPKLFCSNACKSAARRASGVDDIERSCPRCGKTFLANCYSKQIHCSRECAAPGTYERVAMSYRCQHCGKRFNAKHLAKFCSLACRKRYARSH